MVNLDKLTVALRPWYKDTSDNSRFDLAWSHLAQLLVRSDLEWCSEIRVTRTSDASCQVASEAGRAEA